MTPTLLLQKLIDIERSIGIDTDSTLRRKVLEAQECLLRLQAERLEIERKHADQNGSGRFALLRAFALHDTSGDEN